MSLFEDASLVVTPNGRKASKIYSIKPTDGSGDLTVVRATTKTEVNSSGVIVDVPINVPSFDYTNGSCPSILVEPQRTNLLLRSEEFDNATWIKENYSVITPNEIESPNGLLTADKYFVTNGQTGFNRISKVFASTIGLNYTFSIYIKPNGYDFFLIRVQDFLIGNNNIAFDLLNKTVTFSQVGLNGFITEVADGWIRLGFTGISQSNSFTVFFRPQPNSTTDNNINTFVGDGVSGAYLWGAQLEAGSNATSYIPTVASAVTRNADVISKSGISSLIGQTEGTLYADCFIDTSYTISTGICGISGTGLNFIYLFKQSGNILKANVFTTTQQVSLTYTFPNSNFYKIAFKYKQNQFSLFINGVKISSSNSGNVPACSNFNFYDVGLGLNPNGIYKSTCLFKTALTDQQCIELTTL